MSSSYMWEESGSFINEGEGSLASSGEAWVTAVIFMLCVVIMIGNIMTITALTSIPGKKEAMDLYMISLSFACLLRGIFVIPASAAAVTTIGYKNTLCSIGGYLHVTLCAVSIYLYMWIAVDRYLAFYKPLRYEVIQTQTRCECWILFTWVTAAFLCCPPLLRKYNEHFYDDSFSCMMDFGSMVPYSLTLGFLVLGPSIPTLCYTYHYVFTTFRTTEIEDLEYMHTDHITSFILTVIFCLSWIPFGLMGAAEHLLHQTLGGPTLRFCLIWIGQLHAVWVPFVLMLTSARCKTGLKLLCNFSCCRRSPAVSV